MIMDQVKRIMESNFKLVVAACLISLLVSCATKKQPNILILFLDDFGYNDLAFHQQAGSAIEPMYTPNMDAFALESISFSRHYTESTCSPSRAALLSGRYPARFGFTANGRGLPPEIVTLPEALQADGYQTRFLGKWHTGHTTPLAYPHNQGFDSWLGFLNQWMLRSEYDSTKNNLEQPTYLNPWLENENGVKQQFQGHLNDLLAEAAIDFISEAGSNAEPWFLQVSFFAPHEPVQAAERYLALYPDTQEGAYRALVHQLDDNIGSVLDTLEQQELDDDTIVVIVSDNGGTAQRFPSNSPFMGEKTVYMEGGIRTPLMIRWPDGSMRGYRYPYSVSIMDLYPTLLAAANINYDADKLDGRNLLPFLADEEILVRPLYWENWAEGKYLFSVLDESHRWRYSTGFLNDEWLLDLETDPSGTENTLSSNRTVADNLTADYLGWHDEVHRVQTNFEVLDQSGKGILTGDSFQRSPGFGGYTFAIGISPDQSIDLQQRKVIASQSQLLSIYYQNETIEINLQDVRLTGPLPADGQCHSLIVTAQHAARISWLLTNADMNTPIELIVDGEIVDAIIDHREQPKTADLTSPTYIGYQPGVESTRSAFNGLLSAPLIYNHRVVATPELGQFGFESLVNEICPDA